MSQFFSKIITCFAVWLGVLLAWPQPELDLSDQTSFPWNLAREFMGLSTLSDTPLSGLNVVVTGATSGIGKELTRNLSRMGATVVAIGRSHKKLAELSEEVEGIIIPITADFVDLSSVAKAATIVAERLDKVDILINNAGLALYNGYSTTTVQGYDMLFQVNYLSHFLLAEKLLPLLRSSTRSTLVQITSGLHWAADSYALEPMNNEAPKASWPGGTSLVWRDQRSYSNSKLAQILHFRALRRREGAIRTVSICPGWVGTQIGGQKGSITHFFLGIMAFPVNGWGLASFFHGVFRGKRDDDYYINSGAFKIGMLRFYLKKTGHKFVASGAKDFFAMIISRSFILPAQKFFPEVVPYQSSPDSYNVTLQESLYKWSKNAVAEWL